MFDDYDGVIAYLERLIATPVHNEPGAGLLRARFMLSRLGEPQERFVTLHVTGSSGKGSTTTMCAAMLRAAGYRTGTFTSPHLEDYAERIAVDGQSIGHADWTRLLRTLYPLVEEMAQGTIPGYDLGRPALLQVLWPLAALYFAEQAVDIAVVEVGMGGRYDSTRANNARVAVITNVSLEHTQHLGGTIAEIAYHKAGVAPHGGVVVTAAADPAALTVIEAECARQGSALWRVTTAGAEGEITVAGDNAPAGLAEIGATAPNIAVPDSTAAPDFTAPDSTAAPDFTVPGSTTALGLAVVNDNAALRITTPRRALGGLTIGLRGQFQRANAACAVGAIDALEQMGQAVVSDDAVRRGLAAALIPGRFEVVTPHPAPDASGPGDQSAGAPSVILDGAHNPAAARALATALADTFAGRPLVLLLGILGDKDIAAMVEALAPLAASIVVTEPPWEGRMGRGAEVAEAARRYCPNVTLVAEVAAAFAVAQRQARTHGAPLVVAGSLILVGAVRAILRTAAHS